MSQENQSSGLPTSSDTNRAVQPQNMARGLKFGFQEVDELYYLCSENRGADQLRGYWPADLRPCFRLRKKGFLMAWLILFIFVGVNALLLLLSLMKSIHCMILF